MCPYCLTNTLEFFEYRNSAAETGADPDHGEGYRCFGCGSQFTEQELNILTPREIEELS